MTDDICAAVMFQKRGCIARKQDKITWNFTKFKKRNRKHIRKQLQYVRRDLQYPDNFLDTGMELTETQQAWLSVIRDVYRQQK